MREYLKFKAPEWYRDKLVYGRIKTLPLPALLGAKAVALPRIFDLAS
jgi:hypothetical protein